MDTPNEDQEPVDTMELLKQQASTCGAGCDCHGGPSRRGRWILGVIVLVAAAALVGRAVVKNHGKSAEPAAPAFVTLAPATSASQSPANTPEAAATTEASVGQSIASLSELNTVAAANNAVFVYVPGQDGASGNPPLAALESAAGRIGAQGYKTALFTLRAGSHDYTQLTAQMSVPGVLALVKGKGMSVVSGEITETKLIQGFVAAASAGGCGPGGCGPTGCCPPTGNK
jgi:hypothetical protein